MSCQSNENILAKDYNSTCNFKTVVSNVMFRLDYKGKYIRTAQIITHIVVFASICLIFESETYMNMLDTYLGDYTFADYYD